MDKTQTIEDRERKDYEVEIVSLKLHEQAVIPREHFPYALFITSEVGHHYFGRVFLWNEQKLIPESLYFKLEQDENDTDNIRVKRIAEREYLEELSNELLRR